MTIEELNYIKDAFSQIIEDIAGNPDWYEAARAVASDLGTLERELGKKVTSLPFNLDEAAEEYAKNRAKDPEQCYEYLYYELIDAVRFGAQLMAGQGETHEAEIIESVPFGGTKWKRCVKVWLDDQLQAKGDKVVVQIRKK